MEKFSELWSSLRERRKTRNLNETDAESELQKLGSLADSPENHSYFIGEYIAIGASLNRNDILTSGLVQFARMTFEQKKLALDSIGDLSLLGNRMDRWAIIEPVVRSLIPDNSDPAIQYINSGSGSLLNELTQFGWNPSVDIPNEIDREIRIQVGWRAIDEAKKAESIKPFQDFLSSGFLGSTAFQTPREWEFRYLKAFFALIAGNYSHAKAIIESATRRPDWSRSQLNLEARRVAFFAVDKRAEWLQLCSDNVGEVFAGSDEDHLIFKLLDRLDRPSELRPSHINEQQRGFRRTSWLLLLIFLIPELRRSARSEIARIIHSLDDESFVNLPWDRYEDQFASLIGEVDDPLDVLPLAIRVFNLFQNEKLARFISDTFSNQNPETYLQIISSFDSRQIGNLQSLLPKKIQSVVNRGQTWRAIVDASNVLYCGLDTRSGAQPHLKYLQQALKELSEAGFSEIVVFLDRNTLNRVADQEKRTLTVSQTNRELSVVIFADPHCLREFFKKPFNSEIISCDRFSQFYQDSQYPDIVQQLAHVPLKRRTFFRNQQDSISWDTPLNRRILND